jgi:hypothetical protein
MVGQFSDILLNIGPQLTSLSHWSKVKFKSPCNFEESSYVAARVFSPLVIYENVDIDIVHAFIEIYRICY